MSPRTQDDYDFYRCRECNALITDPQVKTALGDSGRLPCGHNRFSPSWPKGLEWLKLSVIGFAFARFRGLA